MVEVILSFIYIFIVTLGVGLLVAYILSKLSIASVWQTEEEYIFTPLVVMGIVGVSVGVEYHSIFGKIGIFAHIILLLASFGGYILNKKRIPSFINQMKEIIFSWEGLFYFGFILLISFYGSRGIFHTDTNIYHAQNIRLYEEYGLIKGMGNLQQHYAYNSSYLAFASIFSLGWLFGDAPLHTTTAFLEAFAGIYAFFGLKRFREHKLHLADGMKIAILFYILVIITGSMSPATDYGTMLMSLILMSLWCDEMEGRRRVECYGLLAVLAVFVLTMKFSACLLVLLAVFPAVMLIKEKQIKKITAFLLMGVMVLAPFFIRNYLIGGWLLYPADFIDIFDVEWKIPKEHLLVDFRTD